MSGCVNVLSLQELQDDFSDCYDESGDQDWLYRQTDQGCGLATIFNADDTRSYFNWRVKLGNTQDSRPTKSTHSKPRFREMIDTEVKLTAFELTGDHDGSVHMVCPPRSDVVFSEELPYLNFIMTDLGGYASIELFLTDDKGLSRSVQAKNFISRTCISETRMEIPLRLRPSWNYACLDLNQLMKDAWNTKYRNVRLIKINANVRIRRIYFSDRMYPHDELPKEFQMRLNLTPKTQLAIEDYENAFPPIEKPLNLNLRPSSWGKSKLPVLEYQLVSPLLPDEEHIQRQKDIARGLKLSIPSNQETLSDMMSKSVQYKPGGEPTPSILWKYPRREEKTYRPANLQMGSTHRSGDASLTTGYLNTDWPNDTQFNEPQAFCDYIWKSSEDGQSGEWDKIENFDIQPQKMAKIHKQRRGEGLYDIYTAKMVTKDDMEYFGFGDNEEEFKLIMKRKSEQTKGKPGALGETDKTSTRLSWVDKSGDWDFLRYVASGVGPKESGPNEGASVSDGVSDHFRSVGTDPSSTGSDEAWLLTWTYEGMDWKETRTKNQAKLNEEIQDYLYKDSRERDIAQDKKASKTPIPSQSIISPSVPSWNQAAIPSKPMQYNQELKGTGAYYHVCFDSKTLPFKK